MNAEGTPGLRFGDGQGRWVTTSGGMGSTGDTECCGVESGGARAGCRPC